MDSDDLTGVVGTGLHPVAATDAATFSYFKYAATGSVLSDDDAFALAVRTLGPVHGELVVDDGVTIRLTHTVEVPYAMTIASAAGGRGLGSVILDAAPGDLFHIAAAATVIGLNIVAQAGSGSIFVLTGDGASVVDCSMANEAGNGHTMVLLEGSGQTLRDAYFSNYAAAAYCWGASSGPAGNSGSSVVGGWAYGPGNGGWVGSAIATTPVSNFVVDGWNCITYGTSQLEARAVDGLLVSGGIYDQSSRYGMVLGNGLFGARDVTVDGVYVSTASNRSTGIAIDAAPADGSGVHGLTILNSQITCAATGVVADATTMDLVVTGNFINACLTGLDLGGAAAVVWANQNFAASPYLGDVPTTAFSRQSGWTIPTSTPSVDLPVPSREPSPDAATGHGAVHVLTTLLTSSPAMTFRSFRTAEDGSVLSDDQAMARAVSYFAGNHGTLIIDPGTELHLTRTIEVPGSMQLVSDGSSSIHFSGGATCIDVTADGPVLIQGLTLVNDGPSGTIVRMLGNTDVLRDVELRNATGNALAMVVLGGPNQLLEDCRFVNSEPDAYCWSAVYVEGGQVNINSAVRGGSAVGVGMGGLVGGATPTCRVEGFEVEDWDCETTGATQVDSTDVLALHVRGGTYTGASEAAFRLGGGVLGCLDVTIENTTIAGAAGSVAIDAAPSGGVGVTALLVSGNRISGSDVGLTTNTGCGAITIIGNSIDTSVTGLRMADTNAPVIVANNVVTAPVALEATVATAPWTTQSYAGNILNGSIQVQHVGPGSYTFVGNGGSGDYRDSSGLSVQPARPSLAVDTSGAVLRFSGTTDPEEFVTVEATVDGVRSVVGTVLASADGTWSLISGSVSGGLREFVATASDALGNVSACSVPVVLREPAAALPATTVEEPAASSNPLLDIARVAAQLVDRLPAGHDDQAAVVNAYDQGAWRFVGSPNELFDSRFYLANNPDVAAAGIDPLAHYLTSGAAEGRDSDTLFQTRFYLAQNPDVAASGMNPLLHFEVFGSHEGRNPNPLFNTSYYLAKNPDVALSGMNPLAHFETFGGREGRDPSPLFDTKYYLDNNPDVRNADINALVHFETFGWKEGRNPDAFFDTGYYLARNPDVAASGVDPLVHYDTLGWKEGRNPSAAFDTNAYLRNNADVRAAGTDPLAQYLASGAAEGRAIYAVQVG